MIAFQKYFPLGLAKGPAFCNRVEERMRLKKNIQSGRHSLITSPRRYGKSSLVLYVLNELKIPYVYLDLFVTIDEEKVEQEILESVKNLISQIIPAHDKIIFNIKELIKKLKLKLIVGTNGVNLELIPVDKTNPAKNIKSALLLLENILVNHHKEAVIFIDEMQEIGEIAEHTGIEGAIRHVAQGTKALKFIFSGSNRRLLSLMFDDRSRPLYKLCDRIIIERIHQKDYEKFIQDVAIKQWNEPLPEKILNKICELTERHPYYMNALCGRIWSEFAEKIVTQAHAVENLWNTLVDEQKSEIAKDLSLLSRLQKKIMIYIAIGKNQHLSSKLMLIDLNTTSASVVKAIKMLEAKDYIFTVNENHYQITDPAIQWMLKSLKGKTQEHKLFS